MDSVLLKYISVREIGKHNKLGLKESLFSSMYTSVKPTAITESTPSDGLNWGAVFGFGFSPDGALLAAACENKCMLLYDPHNAKLINRRFKTHTDCVNCVRFLDDRMFATCSDDSTVRLWDSRFLTQEIKILKEHSSWVKSIEYCSSEGKLITSGFDGNIFTWNINNYSENEKAELLFNTSGIMRIKVTPDEKQMIISTLGGYFLLIHNLDLVTLKEDLKGFKPNFYRSMQLLNLNSHKTLNFKRYFTRDKNRVEIVSDFPENDSAESICTVQVHPQGWCIASRNTTSDEKAEWTCIHDIQTLENITETDLEEDERPSPRNTVPNWHSAERLVLSEILDNNLETENLQSNNDTSSEEEPNVDSDEDEDILQGRSLIVHNSSPSHQLYPSNVEDTSSDDSSHTSSPASIYIIGSPAQGQRHNNANRRALANSFINLLSNHLISSSSGDGHNAEDSVLVEDSHSNIINGSAEVLSRIASFSESREAQTRQHTMFPNSQRLSTNRKKRLLFYSEEPNVGRGFIKEQSFSCDGKVLASPFANCVRLLGFNYECSELCDIVPEKPRNLCQVAMTVAQKSSILASTFSPVHCMFVAGARDGSISFCSPRF